MATHLILASKANASRLHKKNKWTEMFPLSIERECVVDGRILLIATTAKPWQGIPWWEFDVDTSEMSCISIMLRKDIDQALSRNEIIDVSDYVYHLRWDGDLMYTARWPDGHFYDSSSDSLGSRQWSSQVRAGQSSQISMDAECSHLVALDSSAERWLELASREDPARFACIMALKTCSEEITLPSGLTGFSLVAPIHRGMTGTDPEERQENYNSLYFKDRFQLSPEALGLGADPFSAKALKYELNDLASSLNEIGAQSLIISPWSQSSAELSSVNIDDLNCFIRNREPVAITFRSRDSLLVQLSPSGQNIWNLD